MSSPPRRRCAIYTRKSTEEGLDQAFNKTNSMGRLTLNALLSFAQFEREVTGERIRDKIAASRAKGMWMGGNIPLGYDLGDRRLEVNEAEAETIRHIFTRYLDLKSVPALAQELGAEGIHSKRWTSRAGKTHGGLPFHVGALAHILRNKVYRGYAVHKGKAHADQHDAIVPKELFDAVQARLDDNRVKRSARKTRAASSPLTGKIHDANGQPMSVSFSYGRGKKMYRYYVQRLPSSPNREHADQSREAAVLGGADRAGDQRRAQRPRRRPA